MDRDVSALGHESQTRSARGALISLCDRKIVKCEFHWEYEVHYLNVGRLEGEEGRSALRKGSGRRRDEVGGEREINIEISVARSWILRGDETKWAFSTEGRISRWCA